MVSSLSRSKNSELPYDLRPRDLIGIHLDYRQMGVGGDNSWGAQPLEQYRIPIETASWALRLTPLAPGLGEPMDLARTHFPPPTAGPRPKETR